MQNGVRYRENVSESFMGSQESNGTPSQYKISGPIFVRVFLATKSNSGNIIIIIIIIIIMKQYTQAEKLEQICQM